MFVRDIIDIKVDDSKAKKASDKGKYFSIFTDKRELSLMAKTTREAFWFIKGFSGLIREVS